VLRRERLRFVMAEEPKFEHNTSEAFLKFFSFAQRAEIYLPDAWCHGD
jgi:hypothetical protein